MNYRQWKKRYKKLHGVNPPLELDKRRQRRLAKKAVKTISRVDFATAATRAAEAITNAFASIMRFAAGGFDSAGTICRNVADNIQPLEIKGRVFSWQVRKYGSSRYAVYEINALGGAVLPYMLIRDILRDNNGGKCESPDCGGCPFPPCQKGGGRTMTDILLTIVIVLLLAIFGRIDSGFKERSKEDAGNRG